MSTDVGRRRSASSDADRPTSRPVPPSSPTTTLLRAPGRLRRLVLRIVRKCDRDRVLGLAAETAFFAVLGVFPALLVLAAVLGSLETVVGAGVAERVESQVIEALRLVLTDEASGAIASVQQLFDGGFELLTVASALAVVSLSTGFATLVNALNLAYSVPETRSWFRRRFLGLGLGLASVLLGALGLAAVVVGPLFGQGAGIADLLGLDADGTLWQELRMPAAFLALVLWATTLCHLAPAHRIQWWRDLPGGALTAVLWLLASLGLSTYLRFAADGNPVLGALGGGLILMIWIYLLTLSLLIGAELNAILQEHTGARDVTFDRWAESRGDTQPLTVPPDQVSPPYPSVESDRPRPAA
jgi:membrane protein